MTAGRRDTLITIERAAVSTDDYGGETQVWTTHAQEWAAIYYGRGNERRQAAMEQGQQPATFQVLDNASTRATTVKDRITFGGNTWDIMGVAPDTPARGFVELTAVRAL